MSSEPGFNDADAKRIIERAAEIDAEGGHRLDALALREIAAEAGISGPAVDRALQEHGREAPAPQEEKPGRPPWFIRHRSALVTVAVVVIALLILAVARTSPPTP